MLRAQKSSSISYKDYATVMNSSRDTFGRLHFVESMETVEIDANRELFQATYDRRQDSVGMAVVALVTTVLDKEPKNLAPLYSSIDPAAREKLFSESTNRCREWGPISFTYERFEVTVFGDGKIEADPLETA